MDKIKQFFRWCIKQLRRFWPWYKSLYQGKAWYTKALIGFCSFLISFIVYLGMVDMNFSGSSENRLATSRVSWIHRPVRLQKSTVPTES